MVSLTGHLWLISEGWAISGHRVYDEHSFRASPTLGRDGEEETATASGMGDGSESWGAHEACTSVENEHTTPCISSASYTEESNPLLITSLKWESSIHTVIWENGILLLNMDLFLVLFLVHHSCEKCCRIGFGLPSTLMATPDNTYGWELEISEKVTTLHEPLIFPFRVP